MKTILNEVMKSVGNYRNHKAETIKNTDWYLKPYIEQYFNKADKHFERIMDICINIPEFCSVGSIDITSIVIKHSEVEYVLHLSHELTEIQIEDSKFVFELFKRNHLIKK